MKNKNPFKFKSGKRKHLEKLNIESKSVKNPKDFEKSLREIKELIRKIQKECLQ